MSKHKEIKNLIKYIKKVTDSMMSASNYEEYEQLEEIYASLKEKYLHMVYQERSSRTSHSSTHPHKYPRSVCTIMSKL